MDKYSKLGEQYESFPGDRSNQSQSSSCRENLIPRQNHNDYGSVQKNNNCDKVAAGSVETYPLVLINLVVVFMCASGRFHSPLMDQYLYQRFSNQVLGHASVKTASHPCLNDSSSNTSADIRKIQKMTSNTLLQLDLANYGIGIFSCLLLGAVSSKLSRKTLLLIPVTGYLIKCIMIPVVVHWELNVNWFFLGYGAEGVLGNMCGVFLGVYLYISDITPRNLKRTWSMAIIEGLKGVVGAGLNLVTGQLIQRTGFLIPAMLSAGCTILSVIVVFVLPKRKPPTQECSEGDGEREGAISSWWRKMTSPLGRQQPRHVRQMVLLGWIAFILVETATSGIKKVRVLYLMNLPFCFSSIALSWFLFARELSQNGFLIIAIPLLNRFFPGMAMGVLGALSSLAGYIMYALANTDAEIYSVTALSVGDSLPLSLVRGETSRLLGPEAQGALFAVFAVLESFGYALGTPALLVYRASLGFYKSLVCWLFSGLTVLATVLLILYYVVWQRYLKKLRNAEEILKAPGRINS